MKELKRWTWISLIVASTFLTGQTQELVVEAQARESIHDTIPFYLTSHNNIVVQAVLNEIDTLNLMFHTAANSLTLIKDVTVKLSSLNLNKQDTIQSWGGEHTSRYSDNNTLQIGALAWRQVTIWENENSGPMTDGKFGPNLFQDKVIEINYDKHIIIIHATLPKIDEGYEKLKLTCEDDFMFIEGISSIGGVEYKNRFLIHAGFGGTLLLDDQFVNKNKIGDQLAVITEKKLKDSYGNVIKTKKAILPFFIVGGVKLTDIPVGFFEGSIGRQKMSVIGGDFLKRFNIIIDAKRAYIYLKVNGLMNLPFTDI